LDTNEGIGWGRAAVWPSTDILISRPGTDILISVVDLESADEYDGIDPVEMSVTVEDDGEAPSSMVALFPSASDPMGLKGLARVVNHSGKSGDVRILAFDDRGGRSRDSAVLAIGAGETKEFNSDDLEQGNPAIGLFGGVGAGEGHWRLRIEADFDIEVLSYIRSLDGFTTAMHDRVPVAAGAHRVMTFNPASDAMQMSWLRLINLGTEATEVTILGIDDAGTASETGVSLLIPSEGARMISASDLEQGAHGLVGALGDGDGKWRLTIRSAQPLYVMSLLQSPSGHLTNLSTTPIRQRVLSR